MALYDDLVKLIEKRQEELKNYQGAELFQKTAELLHMKNRLDAFYHMDQDSPNVMRNRKAELDSFREGKFGYVENIILVYKRRIASIYKKTGISPSAPLPEITLAKDNVPPAEQDKLEYYITNADLDDETAKKFRNKFYESGIAVTSFPVIDDTAFDGSSFAETLNTMGQPLDPTAVLNLIYDHLRPTVPGMEQDQVNPFDYIRIGGKTADEKWASKYPAGMGDNEKRHAYAFELVQAITGGTEEISLLRPMVRKKENGEKEITYAGKTVLVQSRKNLERTRVFLSELDDFSKLFAREFPTIENPGVQIDPNAQKYFTELRQAGHKLAQRASSLNYDQNSYADFTNAYREYVVKVRQFAGNQMMEMQTNLFEFQRSLQGNPNITNETRQYRQNQIRRLQEEIKNFEPHFRKHLEELEKGFKRVENYSRGLRVTSKDDPWEKEENFTFRKLIRNHRPSAVLRGWGQEPLQTLENVPLPPSLTWVNNLNRNNFFPTPEQKNLMADSSEMDAVVFDRFKNSGHFLEQPLSAITNDEKDEEKVREALWDRGIKGREGTAQSLFCAWAMVKKGLSLEEAARLYKVHYSIGKDDQGNDIYPEEKELVESYEREFVQFCLDHPFKRELKDVENKSPEQIAEEVSNLQKESIRAWEEIFQKGMKKISGYKMPDIDYSDPEQIKEYEDELKLLVAFSVDLKQEMEALVKNEDNNGLNFNPRRYAIECVGGEKNYFEMYNGARTFQELMNTIYKMPYEYTKNEIRNKDQRNPRIFYRANAGRVMCSLRGETIGDILKSKVYDLAPYSPNYNGFVISELEKTEQIGAKTAAYLLHINEKDYLKYVDEKVSLHEDNERENILQNDIGKFCIEARNNPISENFRNALLSTTGDAESMKNFLANKADGFNTGKDLIAKRIYSMIPMNYYSSLLNNNIKASDMFLINGHKPSSIWGNKYQDVADPEEKEWLYRAEIIKCMEKENGTDVIKARMFKLSKENGITDLKQPVTLYTGRKKMKESVGHMRDYLIAKKEILATLLQTRDELISTQENPEANFYSKDRTGSTLYQNFCLAIKDAIRTMETYVSKPDLVLAKLVAVDDSAAAYAEARRKFLGGEPHTDEGKIRFRCSERLKGNSYSLHNGKLTQYFRSHLSTLNSEPISDLVIDPPNKKLSDNLNDHRLKVGMDELNKGLRGTPIDLNLEEDKKARNIIKEQLIHSKSHPDYINLETQSPERQAAIKYMTGFLEDQIEEPLDGSRKKNLKLTTARKAESFWFEVDWLSKNESFLRYVKEDPEGCRKRWDRIDTRAKDIKEQKSFFIKEQVTKNNRSFTSYVANIDANNPQSPQDVIRAARNNPAQMQNYYSRLADVVLLQIMAGKTKESDVIRHELARGMLEENDLKGMILSHLTRNNYLGPRNVDKLENRLKNEETSKALAKTIRERFLDMIKRNEESRENQIRQTIGMLSVMDTNRDGVIQAQEWNSFMNTTGINAGQNSMNEYNTAAGRLNTVLHVNVKIQEDGQPEQVALRDVAVDFRPLQDTLGFNCNDPSVLQHQFILWTMGSKNMEFDAARTLCNTVPKVEKGVVVNTDAVRNADQLRYEFLEFCKKYPIASAEEIPENKLEEKKTEFKENAEEWARVYQKATENMKKFSLPDISYRNSGTIKKYLPMLKAFTTIATKTGQELDGFIAKVGETNAKELLGNDEYRNMKIFWHNMSDCFIAAGKGYNPIENMTGHTRTEVRNLVKNEVFLREAAIEELQNARKYTMGEFSDKAGKDAYAPNHVNAVENIIRANYNSGYPAFTDKEVFHFLQGKTNDTYAKKTGKLLEVQFRAAQNQYQKEYQNDISKFRKDLITGSLVLGEALTQISEHDNYAMIRFLDRKMSEFLPAVEGEDANNLPNAGDMTVRDFLNKKFDTLLSGSVPALLQGKGMNISDLFIIGENPGNPVKEIVDVRFEEAVEPENTSLKEDLYRLELLKIMMDGTEQISVRNFDVVDGKFAELEPVVLMPNDDTVVETAQTVLQLQEAVKDLHNELELYKAELQKTQDNPNANFVDGVRTEGHDEYKAYTKALKKALEVTENGGRDYSPQQIESALTNLSTAAGNYYRTHTGFFGGEPIQDYGKKRYHNSDSVRIETLDFLDRIHVFSRKIPVNIISAGKGELLHSAKLGNAEEVLFNIAEMQGERNNIPEREEAHQKNLKAEMKKAVKAFNRNYGKNAYPATFNNLPANAVNSAIEYLKGLWNKNTLNNELTHKDLKTALHPDKRIKDLATNETFLELYEENPGRCIRHWEDIETAVSERKSEFTEMMDAIKEYYGSYAEYVIGYGPKKVNGRDVRGDVTMFEAGQQLNVNLDGGERESRMYTRLAHTVLMGIMMSDTDLAKRLRYEDAIDPSKGEGQNGFYSKLCSRLSNAMRTEEILDGDAWMSTLERIENGNLFKDMARTIELNQMMNQIGRTFNIKAKENDVDALRNDEAEEEFDNLEFNDEEFERRMKKKPDYKSDEAIEIEGEGAEIGKIGKFTHALQDALDFVEIDQNKNLNDKQKNEKKKELKEKKEKDKRINKKLNKIDGMEDGENIEDLYDENKINDAEKIFFNEAAFREHADIDFDAIDEKEDLDREVGDINYFFGDEEFIEEGDFDNFELNNNQIVQEKIKKLNIEIANSLIINENKENKIENKENKIENNEIKIEELEDRIEDIDEDLKVSVDKSVNKSVNKDEMKGEFISGLSQIDIDIKHDNSQLDDSMTVRIDKKEKRPDLDDIDENEFSQKHIKETEPREFMEKNMKKPANLGEQEFRLYRKQAFIKVYGAEELRKKGLLFTEAEYNKQAKKWLTEEPFKSVLDTMIKENSDKELLALIDNHKVPEEVARIQEGRPKQMKHAGEPEKEKAPKLNGSKLSGPKLSGPKPEGI